jgi:hypothetical protein
VVSRWLGWVVVEVVAAGARSETGSGVAGLEGRPCSWGASHVSSARVLRGELPASRLVRRGEIDLLGASVEGAGYLGGGGGGGR